MQSTTGVAACVPAKTRRFQLFWNCLIVASCTRTSPPRIVTTGTVISRRDATVTDTASDASARHSNSTPFSLCMRRVLTPSTQRDASNTVIWPNFMTLRLRPRSPSEWLPAPCDLVDPSTCQSPPRFEDDPIGALTHCATSTMRCQQRLIEEFDRVLSLGGMREVWIEPTVTCEGTRRAQTAIDEQVRKKFQDLSRCIRSTLLPSADSEPIQFFVGEFQSNHAGQITELELLQDAAATTSREIQLENTGTPVRTPSCLRSLFLAQRWPPNCTWAIYFRTRDVERVPPIAQPGGPQW